MTDRQQTHFTYYKTPYEIVALTDKTGYVSIGRDSIEKISYQIKQDRVHLKNMTNLSNGLTDKKLTKIADMVEKYLGL